MRVVKFIRARWALLFLLLLFGCGTVSVDIQTDVKGEDEVVMAFIIEATGQLAHMLDPENPQSEGLGDLEGWEVTRSRTSQTLTLNAARTFTRADFAEVNEAGMDEFLSGFRFNVTEDGGGKVYRLSMLVEGQDEDDGLDATPDPDDPFAGMADSMLQMMAEMFTISWTVRMPGELVHTNGTQTGNGNEVTWRLDLMDMQQPNELVVESRVQSAGGPGCNP